MGWIALLWLTAIFGLIYVVLPAFARGRAGGRSLAQQLAEALVTTAFVLHFTILALGPIGLALPGLVLVLLWTWLAVETIRHHTWLLQSSTWIAASTQLLLAPGRAAIAARFHEQVRRLRQARDRSGLWIALFAAYFASRAYFAAGNLRFLDSENYSRSLSLAVLSSGQPWHPDSTIPLLLPIQILSALPATAAVRLSGPLVAVLFVLAVAFVAFEYTRSRHAALFAAALCMVAPAWRGGTPGSEFGAPELAATFAVLAVGLANRSRVCAWLAAVLAVGISVSSPFSATVFAGLSCAATGMAIERASKLLHRQWRLNLKEFAAAAVVVTLAWTTPAVSSDGPYQYEEAARACDRLTRDFARNTWLLISSSEEVPFLFGHGWHVPLASFAASLTPEKLADRSFRLSYPVRDVFIFVERQPLRPGASSPPGSTIVRAATTSWADQATVQRASLHFKVARLLAAYQSTHSDLRVVSASDRLIVYHLPGALATDKN